MKKLFLISLLAFFISCQPTKITRTWTEKDIMPKKYKKVLVLGVLTESDTLLKNKIESHLADDLREMGYLAIASHKIFPKEAFLKDDTARAVNIFHQNGFDAVLTVVLLDKKKESYYLPGKITSNTSYSNYSRFDNYYNTVSERIYSPEYYGEETKFIWENNFYDLNSKKMIYSARSRSFDITSINTLAKTYGTLMAKSLVDKKILLKPEHPEDN